MSDATCISHCCVLHGCKYGREDCVVVAGKALQLYLCEDCCWENGDNPGRITRCVNCGSIQTRWNVEIRDSSSLAVRFCLKCSETLETMDAQALIDRNINVNWENLDIN